MILEAMYNGEFYPCETVVPTSPEYRKAVIACEKLMEQLSQRLSKEDYELVQELRAQTAIAQCEESESHFKYGFSAGLMFSRKPMNKCSRRNENRWRDPREQKETVRAVSACASRFIHTLVIKFTTIKSVIALILWGDA